MFANEIEVTKHAIERYQYRINDTLSKEEVEQKLKEIVRKGKYKKLRQCVFEKNAIEFTCEKDNVTVLIILQKEKREKVIFKKAIVITCLGDETTRKWYKMQNIKNRKRVYC